MYHVYINIESFVFFRFRPFSEYHFFFGTRQRTPYLIYPSKKVGVHFYKKKIRFIFLLFFEIGSY